MSHANYKGADQPTHSRSLFNTFVIRCLDGIVSTVSSYIDIVLVFLYFLVNLGLLGIDMWKQNIA